MTAARQHELQPMREVLGSLARRSWLIVTSVAVVTGLTWIATGVGAGGNDDRASARVGLTTAAVWPYFDVAIDEGRLIVDDPSFEATMQERTGLPVESIRSILPDKLSVFDIEVVSDSRANAATVAATAASFVVDEGARRADLERLDQLASLDRRIGELDSQITELELEVASTSTQVAALVDQLEQGFDPSVEEERVGLAAEREVDRQVLGHLQRERAIKGTERDDLLAQPSARSPYIAVSLPSAEPGGTSTRLPISLGAGLAALLITGAATVVIDRRVGRVRSSWQLRAICGADEVSDLRNAGASLRGIGSLVDSLEAAIARGDRTIGVVDATSSGFDLASIPRHLAEHGLATSVTRDAPCGPGNDLCFVDVSHEFDHPDTPRPVSRQCDGTLLVVDRSTTVRQARDLVSRLGSNGLLCTLHVGGG